MNLKRTHNWIVAFLMWTIAIGQLGAQDAGKILDTLIAALQKTTQVLTGITDSTTAKSAKSTLDQAADELKAAMKAARDLRMDGNNPAHAQAMEQRKNALGDAQSKYANALNTVRQNAGAEREVHSILEKLKAK